MHTVYKVYKVLFHFNLILNFIILICVPKPHFKFTFKFYRSKPTIYIYDCAQRNFRVPSNALNFLFNCFSNITLFFFFADKLLVLVTIWIKCLKKCLKSQPKWKLTKILRFWRALNRFHHTTIPPHLVSDFVWAFDGCATVDIFFLFLVYIQILPL